ncbi:uncharacterized protein BP5553_00473 [Venustampulla echinocandica]|uniref:Uncharacterized protein n=1 Tax=Venustampulla echinocandica TaxID=2656787 RepID=A0A370TY97_9HELO|nr:uncharacterized protein BP5553_00473 [Venustampulla echinocandica]RDL40494.1 hypothetical protein BP5553_00473 [Venustampulla echinocandica]
MTSHQDQINEPIAIIGSGCRFPGEASTPSRLWELLRDPRDVLSRIPENRFNRDSFYHPNNMHHGTSNVLHSYFLSEDHRQFDAQFFGIKPVEAHAIDPQQRLLLETVYESVEAAGLSMKELQGSQTAVYVGLMCNDYADLVGRDTSYFPTYSATGIARSIISNRISYFFDWRGPSMTIDTACSSSLVAVHQAVQVLRSGESRVAVAAGSNLILGPEQYIVESNLKMLSPDGRSYMWDERANGYARGEGVASIVLKTLSAAIEDGDDIECIIRETGINQDGKTKGITMPSASAQASLIESTYAKAGLHLSDPRDRPQYFEAHGTGTPAGDPIEAEAISTAFFRNHPPKGRNADPLFVGSIKTVVGHTEGTAGLAGLLKASLALQNGVIPPNRLFDKLAPAVKPFYDKLEIARNAKPWPSVEHKAPRRASVNSFGFGGANAHCILESYTAPLPANSPSRDKTNRICTPFTFSAISERSLAAVVASYSEFLKAEKSINLRALSHTLNSRRVAFPVRVSFSASDLSSLCSKLDLFVEGQGEESTTAISSSPGPLCVLGIFTGQGAQWAQMGAKLMSFPAVTKIVDSLERSLADLPRDRPKWSLKAELLADKMSSRVGEAALSQPLCTAVQIILVDLVRAAGIHFAAVVGHSSGEIGAAYAAGYITASDAIRIAYYRGVSLRLAQGKKGQAGGMIAVGTSYDDAKEFCNLRKFRGKVCMAASNSATSVTISGDADAIDNVRAVFEEEKKFARVLKVDKAYHSHHMAACSESYLNSLRACGIKARRPVDSECLWVSSVYQEDINDTQDDLSSSYWVSNLVSPVLFSQAVEYALGEGRFDLAIELGPHPALKGPASQVIQDALGDPTPYTGFLNRGVDDIEAFSNGLGNIWSSISKSAVNFTGYDSLLNKTAPLKLLKGLPPYSWEHERAYWHESRVSKSYRERQHQPHELLGTRSHNSSNEQVRWDNYLIPKELPWISGHQIQGQMVFPAAGYMSTAFEAAREIAGIESMKLIELRGFTIGQALVFDTEDSSVEIHVSLTEIQRRGTQLSARFNFFSTGSKEPGPMLLNASGNLHVTFGYQESQVLPPMPKPHFAMMEVESDRFYDSFAENGYRYTGPFKALSSMERKTGVATGLVAVPASINPEKRLIIHPAALDAAVQSILLAYCYPGDGRLRTLQLPTHVSRIAINPTLCVANSIAGLSLNFISTIIEDGSAKINGDVDLYPMDSQNAMLQLEGMHTTPMVPPTEATDFHLFSEAVWDSASPDAMSLSTEVMESYDFSFILERVAHFYLRNLQNGTTLKDRENCEWHHKHLFSYLDTMLLRVANGIHPFAKREWVNDTHDEIQFIVKSYPDSIDLRLMHAVGENIIAVVRGEMTMLEPMIEDNMLNDFYVLGFGMSEYLQRLSATARQIGHRHPNMNVLEIGAGTGGATKSILRELDEAFALYTFTDISSGFFEKAKDLFKARESKMVFKTLDIEKDVVEQGFAEHSFDLIVASLVLHATTKLEETMKNVRQLLKPGGYLLLLEITDNDPMRFGFIFGGLPGWWLGVDDGRSVSPCIEPHKWETLLKHHGFYGIDSMSSHKTNEPIPLCVILGQAMDYRVDFLRDPLSTDQDTINLRLPELTIIGGSTPRTSSCVSTLASLLGPYCDEIGQVKSLVNLDTTDLSFGGSVICMQDHDDPTFKSMSEKMLKGYQKLFEKSKNVIWITRGYKECEPYAKMVVGFARCLIQEMPHVRLQFLDINPSDQPNAKVVAEAMLTFAAADMWEDQGRLNDLFWSVEPEMAFEKGQVFIPRIQLSKSLNNRYNSSSRLITQDVDPKSRPVTLTYFGDTHVLKAESGLVPTQSPDIRDNVEIQVSYSILKSVKIGSLGYFFLVLGTNTATGDQIISLSTSLSSQIKVPVTWTYPCMLPPKQAVEYLATIFYTMLSNSVLFELPRGGLVVVLEPSKPLEFILETCASKKGIHLKFLTPTSTTAPHQESWTTIHPRASKRDVETALPHNISRIIVCKNSDWSSAIRKQIPAHHIVETLDTLTQFDGGIKSSATDSRIPHALEASRVQILSSSSAIKFQDIPISSVQEILEPSAEHIPVSVVNWGVSTTVPIKIEPVDARPLFKNDKTYWLVGLTGGLGLSLCRWMVNRGARYIAISSRNPKVDPRWISDFEAAGATVKVYANDVTNRDSLRLVHQQIQTCLPPIIGVCQGAMVLHDTLFLDLDMERMEKVLKPKVDGAVYLDEIFSHQPLDFFVFLSSMASITGNPGQSAYGAANMFLAGLAAQRRRRGVAASTVHIGAIVGNGYVTRELSLGQQVALQKVGHTWMSEQDFYQIFAEAVVASPPRPGPNPEYFTGLRLFYADEEEKPHYAKSPIFSHLTIHRNLAGFVSGGNTAVVSVKTQLLKATTHEEVYEILKVSLVLKLQVALQTPADLDVVSQTADALGIDSLVSVDLRSWFMKELNVDMPVLKILSGATIGELLERAQELLDPTLIPNIGAETATEKKLLPEKPKVVRKPVVMPPKPKFIPSKPAPVQPVLKAIPSQKLQPHPTATPVKAIVANKPADMELDSESSDLPISHDYPAPNFKQPVSEGHSSESILSISTRSLEPEILSDAKISSPNSLTSSFEEISRPSGAKSGIQRVLPMSFSQSRFWFLKFYLEDQTTFNVTTSIHLRGNLRVEDLAQAVATIGQRHESLRTRFFTDENHQPMQAILEFSVLRLETRNISDDDEISKEYASLKNHVYDLENGETLRIILLSLSPVSHQILLGYHHINMDGVSFELFFSDLQKAYDSSLSTSFQVLQYPDFASRQRKEYLDGEWSNELRYWRNQFPDIPSPLPLLPVSTLTSRLALTKYGSHMSSYRVTPELSAQVYGTCKKLRVSPFQFYLAVYRVMIFRWVETDDYCIGVADANRSGSDVQQSLGCYLNLLPIRFNTRATNTFSEAVKETKTKAQQAFANSKVPFNVLLSELNVPRSSSESPLFQVFLNYRQGVAESRTFCDCDCEWTDFDGGQIAYDLSLDVVDNAGGDALLRLSVQKDLYTSQDGEILIKSFVNLLDAFSRNPASRLSRPPLFAGDDIEKAISLGRGSISSIEWQGTVIHRIDEIAQSNHQAPALKDGLGNSLTYAQMHTRANVIAVALSDLRVGNGSRVGVFQEPSTDWICSILAILRLGAVYVPLDPWLTTMRLAVIVKDCQPDAILTDNTNKKDFPLLKSQSNMVNVSKLSSSLRNKTIPNVSKEDSTMTVLYTSGSTGTPKGVVMKHSAIRAHVETVTNTSTSEGKNKIFLQQSSFSFDMSLVQILWPLCSGGSIYVVPQSGRGDPVAISNIISSENISVTAATPSEYISWIRFGDLDSVRKSTWTLAISGGELVTRNFAQVFRDLDKPGLQVMNCYGPTEITFFSHFSEFFFADNDWVATSPSLVPWTNYATYIVDSSLKPVPAGVPGEVVISGMGVSSGYLNMKEITNQRFLADNFASNDFIAQGWNTMHLTGDRGRLLPDGSLLLEGRIAGDTQIKLRGLRVDLQDIEAAIISSSQGRILHAIVSVRRSQPAGPEFLVGHVEFSPRHPSKNTDAFIKSILLELPLPQYMHPALIIPVEDLPRTSSGKIDRLSVKLLPLAQKYQSNNSSQALNETEPQLLQLWEEILTTEVMDHFTIDSQSDFFQVGGSSLLLVQLQALIKKTFSIDLPLVQLFDVSTLGKMAARIHNGQHPNETSSPSQVPEIADNTTSRLSAVDESIGLGAQTSHSSDLLTDSNPGDSIHWEMEVSLSSSLEASIVLGVNVPRAVVLTGSTGFLGKAILQRLVSTPSIEKIYCIAVRPNSQRSDPVFSSPKVLVYTGDQSLPLLGLTYSETVSILSDADAIIHNAADVSFLKTYYSLRKTNVESTKQLADWAVIHGLQFHYISTASVTYLSGQESYPSISVRDFKPPVNGSNGYIASKWASEVHLERMNQKFGMPLVIHRPSSITGPGASETDVMSSLLKYSKMLHAIPKSDYIKGYFDFISVEKAANEIVESVQRGVEDVEAQYVFESGELQMESEGMKKSMEMQTGESFVELSIWDWVKRAEILGLNSMVAAFLNGVTTQGLLMTKLVKD